MSRPPVRYELALTFLDTIIGEAGSAPGARLPSVALIAQRCGVATVTMWRAVRRRVNDGTLSAKPRDGVRVIMGPKPVTRPLTLSRPSYGTRATRIADLLESEILRGRATIGVSLPAVKELQVRFGCSYHTVRRALDTLVSRGVLVEGPGGRRVRTYRPVETSSSVLFVSWMPGDVYLTTVERETTRAGARLRVLPLLPRETLLTALRQLGREPSSKATIGAIVSLTGGYPWQYREIVSLLLALGKPVAILDTTGGATDTGLPKNPHLRTFTLARHRTPGVAMGTFLLELGHRRVAYICPMHATNWSAGRLDGLRQVYCAAGLSDAVSEYVSGAEPEDQELTFYSSELESIVNRLAANDTPHSRQLAAAIDSMAGAISFEAQWRWLADRQQPLMDSALKSRECTAWVAGNDRSALIALEYLKSRAIRVPADISVVGFDDLPAAYSAGLTSYNPNSQDAVQAALSHVFGAHRPPRAQDDNEPVEIEGFISMRNTTAVA